MGNSNLLDGQLLELKNLAGQELKEQEKKIKKNLFNAIKGH